MPGRFALLGSGEFEPWTAEVDDWLLRGRGAPGEVLICPTASAPEGDAVFDSWGDMGLAHFEAAGVPARVLQLKTRRDASRPEVVGALTGASAVYFSGGNPWYLAEVLRGTPFWQALRQGLSNGLGYAGCSAGVACLTERTFDSAESNVERIFKPGLGLARPGLLFAPHWDQIDDWVPGARAHVVASIPADGVLVGLDSGTGLVGDGRTWRVMGAGGVHVLAGGDWAHVAAGGGLELTVLE